MKETQKKAKVKSDFIGREDREVLKVSFGELIAAKLKEIKK